MLNTFVLLNSFLQEYEWHSTWLNVTSTNMTFVSMANSVTYHFASNLSSGTRFMFSGRSEINLYRWKHMQMYRWHITWIYRSLYVDMQIFIYKITIGFRMMKSLFISALSHDELWDICFEFVPADRLIPRVWVTGQLGCFAGELNVILTVVVTIREIYEVRIYIYHTMLGSRV